MAARHDAPRPTLGVVRPGCPRSGQWAFATRSPAPRGRRDERGRASAPRTPDGVPCLRAFRRRAPMAQWSAVHRLPGRSLGRRVTGAILRRGRDRRRAHLRCRHVAACGLESLRTRLPWLPMRNTVIARPRTTARSAARSPQRSRPHTTARSHAADCSTRNCDRVVVHWERSAASLHVADRGVSVLGEIAMCEALACDFCLAWTSSSCSSRR